MLVAKTDPRNHLVFLLLRHGVHQLRQGLDVRLRHQQSLDLAHLLQNIRFIKLCLLLKECKHTCSVLTLGTTSLSLSKASFRPFILFLSLALAMLRRCFMMVGVGGCKFFFRPPFPFFFGLSEEL